MKSQSTYECEWCVDGLQADGETPCPCQEGDLPRQVRDFKRDLAEANEKIASLSAKVADVERERDEKIARAMAKADYEAERAGDIENENDALLARVSELQREVERKDEALRFYASARRYNGSNQRNDGTDEFTPADRAYIQDVTRDGGSIARAALQQEGE